MQNIDIKSSPVETYDEIKSALKSKIDYLDLENIYLYTSFSKPIVAIVSTHPTIGNIEKNYEFYQVVVKFI